MYNKLKNLPTDISNIILEYNEGIYQHLNKYTIIETDFYEISKKNHYFHDMYDYNIHKIKNKHKYNEYELLPNYCKDNYFMSNRTKMNKPLRITKYELNNCYLEFFKYKNKEILRILQTNYCLEKDEIKDLYKKISFIKNNIFSMDDGYSNIYNTQLTDIILCVKNNDKNILKKIEIFKYITTYDYKYKCKKCDKKGLCSDEVFRIDCICCIYPRYICNECY